LLKVVRLRGIPGDDAFVIGGWPELRMVPSDSTIAHHLFWLGASGYEAGGPAWWAALVAVHEGRLEIGANVGLYTLLGARAAPGGPYRAVEPHPISCSTLRRNLALNGFDWVEVVEAAVVGERAVAPVQLSIPDRDPYGASAGAFVRRGDARPAARTVAVPAVAMEDLIDGVDLVKLDIEGSELDVLGSVRPWLVARRPTLVVEVLDHEADLQRFLAALAGEIGLRAYVVTRGGPTPVPLAAIDSGRLNRTYGTRDVTLITPKRAARALAPADRTPQ
jgi:FkbM family methyltransferase